LKLSGSGSGDDDNDDAYAYAEEWWEATQEETLEMFNDVYEDYKYCTSCIDYPTYQDGFFIGEDGTDEDDLINQCWKFYSHDSFVCESNCIALAHEQGSITAINYGGKTFGVDTLTGYSSGTSSTSSSYTGTSKSNKSRVAYSPSATFLAFAVARGNGKKERSRTSRTKRLLPSRSKDGSRSRKMRSKSRSRRDGGQSRSKSRTGEKSSARSKSRSRDTGEYEPPAADNSRPPRRGKSKSRSKPSEEL
jgi:hypothetical protein